MTPRCDARRRACGSSTARRTTGCAVARHSSIDVGERRGVRRAPRGSRRRSSRRPAGRAAAGPPGSGADLPSSPTTSSPDVRLAMISLLSRSDASARAVIARSCARSLLTASSIARRHERGLGAVLAMPARDAAGGGEEAQHGEREHRRPCTATIAVRPRSRMPERDMNSTGSCAPSSILRRRPGVGDARWPALEIDLLPRPPSPASDLLVRPQQLPERQRVDVAEHRRARRQFVGQQEVGVEVVDAVVGRGVDVARST